MALINLRNALMAGKRLPYDAEVEFLESTGTQWIDTGTPIAYADKIELTFATTASGTQYIFGDSISGSSLYRWEQTSANKFAIMTGNGSTIGTPPSISTNTVYTVRVENKVCYLNDVQFATITNADPSAPRTAHAYLFTWNAATIAGGKCRVYSLKIYDENGNAIRDFIPVRKGTTGELYDRVSGKFAERHGDFVVGQNVVPVEYIESHGTEWIDTGYSSTGVGIGAKVSCEKTTSATWEMSIVGRNSNEGFDIYFSGGKCGLWNKSGGSITSDVAIVANTRYSINAAVHSSGGSLSVNGELKTSSFSPRIPSAADIVIFRHNYRYYFVGKIYDCELYDNDVLVRNFHPVRVGTEGAMMDVLTRRIYRNQGTGAFGYGNDLRYPIPAE